MGHTFIVKAEVPQICERFPENPKAGENPEKKQDPTPSFGLRRGTQGRTRKSDELCRVALMFKSRFPPSLARKGFRAPDVMAPVLGRILGGSVVTQPYGIRSVPIR